MKGSLPGSSIRNREFGQRGVRKNTNEENVQKHWLFKITKSDTTNLGEKLGVGVEMRGNVFKVLVEELTDLAQTKRETVMQEKRKKWGKGSLENVVGVRKVPRGPKARRKWGGRTLSESPRS